MKYSNSSKLMRAVITDTENYVLEMKTKTQVKEVRLK
jgi:hypothetical protein